MKKNSYTSEKADLVSELASRATLLAEPAPSWEPRAHDRHRAAYNAAAIKLAELEVAKYERRRALANRRLDKWRAERDRPNEKGQR